MCGCVGVWREKKSKVLLNYACREGGTQGFPIYLHSTLATLSYPLQSEAHAPISPHLCVYKRDAQNSELHVKKIYTGSGPALIHEYVLIHVQNAPNNARVCMTKSSLAAVTNRFLL